MKVRMLTISAGPDASHCWNPGDERDLPQDDAMKLIATGQAHLLERSIPVETANVTQPEQATVAYRGKAKV
jgi:hypothetical protein